MMIKKIRKELGLTQTQFARILGVHQTAVSQWETGRTKPETEVLARMARMSGHSLQDLLEETLPGNETPSQLEVRMSDGGMAGARILEGDTVYLQPISECVEDGIIAAVEIETGVTVRYLYHSDDKLLLVPAAPGFPPQSVPANARVLGRAYAFSSTL